MKLRDRLLKHLKGLQKSQLNEALFHLESEYPVLTGQINSECGPVQLAMQMIRIAEQETNGLTSLCELLKQPFCISGGALAELEEIQRQFTVSDPILQQIFTETQTELGSIRNVPDSGHKPLLDCLIDGLLDPPRLSTGEIPLLHFIGRLAPRVQKKRALQTWVEKTARALELSEEQIRGLLMKSKITENTDSGAAPLYVLISLAPVNEPPVYTLRAWFGDAQSEFNNIFTREIGANLEKMPEFMQEIFARVWNSSAARNAKHPLTLEFFLPLGLLGLDLDRWTPPKEKPLSTSYRLVVRSSERFIDNIWVADWRLFWNRYHNKALCEPARQCSVWFTRPAGCYGDHLERGKLYFGLNFAPEQSCFEEMLQEGIAILLWPRQALKAKTIQQIKERIARRPLQDLPQVLLEIRRALHKQNKPPGFFSLLWDDPHRMPKEEQPLPFPE